MTCPRGSCTSFCLLTSWHDVDNVSPSFDVTNENSGLISHIAPRTLMHCQFFQVVAENADIEQLKTYRNTISI